MQTMRENRPSRGFTLVEMMMAMAIFLVASTGLLSLLLGNLQASRQTQLRSQARQLASETMAELQVSDYAGLAVHDGQVSRRGAIEIERTIEADLPSSGQTRLTVTASWRQRDRNHAYRLQAWRTAP